jgi:hypothetical protein
MAIGVFGGWSPRRIYSGSIGPASISILLKLSLRRPYELQQMLESRICAQAVDPGFRFEIDHVIGAFFITVPTKKPKVRDEGGSMSVVSSLERTRQGAEWYIDSDEGGPTVVES